MADNMLTINGFEVWVVMAIIDPSSDLHHRFFAPLWRALEASGCRRECQGYSDWAFLELGVSRVVTAFSSGRGFLQSLAPAYSSLPGRSNFFEALKSARRLSMVEGVAEALRSASAKILPDMLAQFEQLNNFDIYAADGHSHEHACHDAPIGTNRPCVTHLFARNLRTGWLSHLSLCPLKEKGNHHDMAVLKSLSGSAMRQGAKKGRKVIYVYDRAGLDFEQWHRWKQGHGVYFISRPKETVNLSHQASREYDHSDPINTNVHMDHIVTPATSRHPLRHIVFWDAIGGVMYEFLTNEMTLPPGLIAQLYKMRWNIEKSFDEIKNKLNERKAWASSDNAKRVQAQVLCLAVNLMLLLSHHLDSHENIRNEAEIRRRQKRLEDAESIVAKKGAVLPLPLRQLQHLTQNSVKLIRWVAALLFRNLPWNQALDKLRRSYATL